MADRNWQTLLGYLNFSEGRPDPRFAQQLDEVCREVQSVPALAELLRKELAGLKAVGSSAFQDSSQVEKVIELTLDRLLPAYRSFHADLLAHLSEVDFFQPYLIVRAFEAVLAQGGPWHEAERIVADALKRLNDFVGYRPVPVLETRPKGEAYEHERYRPVPLYIRGAGPATGRYHDLLQGAIDILRSSDPGLLADAQFELDVMEELAVDVRAYDHSHPANSRTNYLFGEWDPHHLDSKGRHCRFVVRQLVLDGLREWAEKPGNHDRAELRFEASAVLACVILMAAGVCGATPTALDSGATLRNLKDRIAQYRDTFYAELLKRAPGAHGDRMRQEAEKAKQPLPGVRQHINQYMLRHSAGQLQQRHLALLLAEMGHGVASREQSVAYATPATRFAVEITLCLSQGHLHADRGDLLQAVPMLDQAWDWLRRGIDCGAIVDPWNILGYQGLFPISPAREDSIRDPRIDGLVEAVDRLLHLHTRLVAEAAAGHPDLLRAILDSMRKLAIWWDQFAAPTVTGLKRVHGGESVESAEQLGRAVEAWHAEGEAAAALAFWRKHLADFRSPRSFALVVEALLRKEDQRATQATLLYWFSQAEAVGLEDGAHSFHALATRWLLAATTGSGPFETVRKFFDHLEANAEDFWQVPQLSGVRTKGGDDDEEENPFGAAYEGMTYRDSADDGTEGELADDGPTGKEFALELDQARIEQRLRFLATLARLWSIAAHHLLVQRREGLHPDEAATAADWLSQARENRQRLLALLDALNESRPPTPLGTYEAMIEYQRQLSLQEHLLETALGTCVETAGAIRMLASLAGTPEPTADDPARPAAEALKISPTPADFPPPGEWEEPAVALERALVQGDADSARRLLPGFIEIFRNEPLLVVPISSGGHPGPVLRTRLALAFMDRLLDCLPRLGLARESFHLLQLARSMEQTQPHGPRRVSEFHHLFPVAFRGVVECLVESSTTWADAGQDRPLVEQLDLVMRPFMRLWGEHTQSLTLSPMEKLEDAEWQDIKGFIQKYGKDLLTPHFLTVPNLRAVLYRGVGEYLNYLVDHPDPEQPISLLDDLDRTVPRDKAIRIVELIARAVEDNAEEYVDYSRSTAQAAYGSNLHLLLEFLRVKANYERNAWRLRPAQVVHEVLVRRGKTHAAELWHKAFARSTQKYAEEHLGELDKLEERLGVKLRTIRDRFEERFYKLLDLDRLCALVKRVADEGKSGGGPALAEFLKELQPYTASPTGAGLDLPAWLRRLHQEYHQIRSNQGQVNEQVRRRFQVPTATLSHAQIKDELTRWNEPIEE